MPIPTIRVRIRTDLKQAFKQSLEAMPFLPLSLLADVRFAVRLLVKRPWITAMIVGVLAAGIAVNSAVFTLANAVMIRGFPFEDGNRILHLENNDLQRGRAEMRVSYPDYLDWRSQTRTFAELGAFRESEVNISDDSSWPERRDAAFISPNSFGMILRVQALIGRTFIAERAKPGAARWRCSATALGNLATEATAVSSGGPFVSTAIHTRSWESWAKASDSPPPRNSGFH